MNVAVNCEMRGHGISIISNTGPMPHGFQVSYRRVSDPANVRFQEGTVWQKEEEEVLWSSNANN
jgi:hypothetical protein